VVRAPEASEALGLNHEGEANVATVIHVTERPAPSYA
jgi:hypothetical protein